MDTKICISNSREEKHKGNIPKGNSNEGVDGVKYATDQSTDTTKTAIVHPGFNLGGTQLRGFWTAKFEASGTNKDGKAVGNASSWSDQNNMRLIVQQ